MATGWSFTPKTGDASGTDKEEDSSSEYKELYERAREATKEAQREGDAQLKAAMAAATAVGCSPIILCPLSLKFNNARLERAYWRKSSTNSDHKDFVPFAFQFLLYVTLISLLFQAHQGRRTSSTKEEEVAFLRLPNFFTKLVSYIWAVIICTGVLVMHLAFSSWYRGNRGTILLIVASFLWIGEGIKLLALCPDSTHDLVLILIQCIFMSALHRVPFCLHLKTRALGFGLQMVATLARVRVDEAITPLFFVCMGHSLGVVLAYVLDQQSRAGFLQSLPRFILDEMSGGGSSTQFLSYRASLSRQMWNILYPELFEMSKGDINVSHIDSQLCRQQTPRRALGGFAGGFGGVSSLKGTYAPPFSTVASSNHNTSGEDRISEYSCNSSTGESNIDGFSCQYQYFPCRSLSHEDQGQSSSRFYTKSVLECSMYRRFRAGAREDSGS